MSQKLLVFLAGLLLVSALGSYLYYRRSVARTPVDPWALVPDDAVLVAATRDHPTLVRHLKETQIWDNLTGVRYFQQVEENSALIDSIAGSPSVVLRFLGTKLVLTSVHVTGPGTFDLLFQVPIATVREYRQLRGLVNGLGQDARYRVATREYRGQQITDVRQRGTGHGITFLNYRNQLIISTNAGLVESVVRRLEQPELPSIAADFKNTDYLQHKDVDAMLLLNYRQFPRFLGVFFRPKLRPSLESITGLSRNGLLGMKLVGNKILFNGFTNPETTRDALHQRLRGQPAQRLRMADVLPLRTALLLHLGLRDMATLPVARRVAADTLAARTGALLDSLTASFSREAAVCYLGSSSPRQVPAKLALVYCPSPTRTATLLGQLRRLTGTSPSFERVGPYRIYQGGVPELPSRLLGGFFTGFDEAPVVAQVGDYLAFGKDAATLRTWLDDVVGKDTWTTSPAQVAFLQETQPLARVSLIMDTRNSWNVLLRALVEERRADLLRNEALFKRFPQLALQFVPPTNEADPDAQYYTQLLLRHPAVGPAVASPQGANDTGGLLTFKTPLASSPTLISVQGARLPGALVQDKAQVLHYVTPDNVVAWSDTLPGPLVGSISRLPVGGNLGYLLATPTQLHLLDPQGRSAPNFPLNLPDTVRASSLTAGPGIGKTPPGLLVGGGGGNLFLFDTNGRAFPGWQPKRLDFNLAAPPHYLVVGGRTVIVALLENGYVYAYNQQGNLYPGFPLSVGARLNTGAFVEAGTTLGRTRLTVVNQHGERITFSLGGDVVSRGRIATWNRNSVFRLVPELAGRGYVVAREEGGRVSIFDPSGRQLLTQNFLTSGRKPVQYFDFGAGRRVVVITEPAPHRAYIYDAQGRLVGGQPFVSTAPEVGLHYETVTGTYYLFRTVDTELRRTDLKMN
ncbi:hypothetical protein SAMN00120144_1938 [Hymenobacter roseosalivarius DSM 11622]|uniref:Uncharacterized protein n=1 Tax=Hymenobacter roseosalivarius DSM 11622 TaxID=645990 RepID=A0A1W1W5E3_9BACT|nr:hypothetical protein [Hymenobacter roseosalivarius]SMC00324.1 hypothetical protein SAMN00120144_1938 [Hymenobacter roseosalivarius DSM 11622]